MKKKLLACLLFLFPFVAFAGHAHAETIKVVFDTAYAPFEFKDSDQTYKGIDVEILDKVAEINGYLYPVDSDAQLRSITEYIYQIRQKFKIHQIDPIKTVWGGGYKWKKN